MIFKKWLAVISNFVLKNLSRAKKIGVFCYNFSLAKNFLIILFFLSFPLLIFADEFSLSPPGFSEGKTPEFLTLLGWILKTAFFTISILAVLMIVVGGVQYVLAGSTGNPEKIGDAQNRIMMSVYGILLALSSWLILNTINPDLLKLELNIPGLGGNSPGIEGKNQNWVCIIEKPCSVTKLVNEGACASCMGLCRFLTPEQEVEARQRCNL